VWAGRKGEWRLCVADAQHQTRQKCNGIEIRSLNSGDSQKKYLEQVYMLSILPSILGMSFFQGLAADN
jgi:hypothetical protein